jgi:hypothetical protein
MSYRWGYIQLLNPFRVLDLTIHFPRITSGVIQIKPLRGYCFIRNFLN